MEKELDEAERLTSSLLTNRWTVLALCALGIPFYVELSEWLQRRSDFGVPEALAMVACGLVGLAALLRLGRSGGNNSTFDS